MLHLKCFCCGLMCFSLLASSAPKKKETSLKHEILKQWDCLSLNQKIGVGSVVTGLITTGLWTLSSVERVSETEKDKRKKKNPLRPIPAVANKGLNDFNNDQELFSAASDLTDYLLDKYVEDSKLSQGLSFFIESYPVESATALKARFPDRFNRPSSSREVFQNIGRQGYYPLIFAWIITEVYNQKESPGNPTLHDVISGIEKAIQSAGNPDSSTR